MQFSVRRNVCLSVSPDHSINAGWALIQVNFDTIYRKKLGESYGVGTLLPDYGSPLLNRPESL